ncbi:hypothetical protein [Streptomyces sp. H27-D2]|uniref:hypothetical protein n=1 Tax=Streptomyces sp. H27-D2 TaxID=3046304 RepID=UPI002DB7590F|nr:hypothetical protein [Streptomyces sp. H27-D2]MEC4018794.1 hypothetical protein [Streptomyces sp. H27-D2]
MAVKIKNLRTSGPIAVPLSTGTTLRLSPGQVSQELHDVEVADNAKVEKLRGRGEIEVEAVDEASGPDSGEAAEDTDESVGDSVEVRATTEDTGARDAQARAGESRSRARPSKRPESSG